MREKTPPDRLKNWNKARLKSRLNTEEARRAAYEEYMNSPQWEALRLRVLTRARGICECCLISPAVQVHHLTYEHFMHEYAWELRAVCMPCHQAIHADGKLLY